MGFTGFYWVLPGFTGFYWVLLGFTGFYWVLLGITRIYCDFQCFTEFIGFYWLYASLCFISLSIFSLTLLDVFF